MEQNNISERDDGEVEPRCGEPGGPAVCAADRWRAIIVDHRISGLAVAAFCRGKSIPTSSFYGWRQKLAGVPRRVRPAAGVADRLPPAQSRGLSGPGGGASPDYFLPVKLACRGNAAGAGQGRATLELRLRGGRRVLLRRGFDHQLLIEAMGVLEALA
jgi:hypothetical protein